MTAMEELMQAALGAPEERRQAALRALRGECASPAAAAERYLTLKECAAQLGLCACSLWRWKVPGHELGGRRRFRMSEVQAYLESDEFKTRADELKAERAGGTEARKR